MWLLKKIMPDKQIDENEYTAKFVTLAQSEDRDELYKMLSPEEQISGEYLVIHAESDCD